MNSQTPNHQSGGDSKQVHQPRPQAGPDELLSSYLDDELSADEIVAVEAHLEVSEESRRALEDLRSLSNYLSSFPVEPIPESPVVSAAASKDEAPGTPTRRLPLIAAAVAAAVLVILAAVPGDPESPPTMVASHNASTPEQDQPSAEADTHLVQPDSADQLMAGRGFGSTEVAGDGLVLPKSLDKAQVGQILSAVDFSDGDAVVVRLTVVDIEQGLDSLRLLLQKHHIARADAIASVTEDRASTERPKGQQHSTDHLVSVVVQASPKQVSDAMSQLRREVQAEVKLAGVLRVAALETAPGGRRALSRLNTYGNDITRSPRIVAKAAANRRSTPTEKKRAPKARPVAAVRDASALASAQVRLDLPARLMQKVHRTKVDTRRSETRGREQADRRMQVVFVLVTPPQPATRPGSEPDGAA